MSVSSLSRPLALAALALLSAGPVLADDYRYGLIYISGTEGIAPQASWRLKISDRLEKKQGTYPFGADSGGGREDASQSTQLKDATGTFRIWETRKPKDQKKDEREILANGMEVELKTDTYYTVAFSYGRVGLKAFNRVVELRSYQASGALIHMQAGTYSTGSTLSCEVVAQADAQPFPDNFKLIPGESNRFLFNIRNNGKLVDKEPMLPAEDKAIFIYVQKSPR
jgi:hypothetical protein